MGLLLDDIESDVVRLTISVRLRAPDGWSDPRKALIDPGAPYCLLPLSLWSTAEHRVLSRRDLSVAGIGSGTAAARYGLVTLVVEDGSVASPPLRVRAFLLEDDSEPLLLGFEDFLTHAILHSDYPRRIAYLEFPVGEGRTTCA